ncbi:MAG: ATP-binding cassette domain-containing protein [Thiotrichales bacterium]|nr:ATP-binding cassette domain-containing protein [Thiotrichales bacterium]
MSTALLQIEQLSAPGMKMAMDWCLQAGQLWLLFGRSGSGKSQLLKAVADLIPHQGQVFLNGVEAAQIPAPLWRRQVMYFSAETAWWRETVALHFRHPPSEQQLAILGLEPSVLTQPIEQLSSGQKQRLALLRGLAWQPKVLLLDETSANLDPESTQRLEALVKDYLEQQQAAAIWISHDVAQQQRLGGSGFCRDLSPRESALIAAAPSEF